MMAPLLDEVARKRAGEVLIVKLDTDRNPATGERFGIRGIPTMILFRQGKEIARRVGAVPPQDLDALVNST
jgi:thioredoxin-like negative regulator of GroEL